MKQIIQDVRSGATTVRDIPAPLASSGHIVLAATASVISAGTERYVVDLARKSLIGKARQRPQDVKRVLQKLREDGIRTTLTQVSAKLDEPMPLGYSAAGIVLECGAGVQEFKPGDRIAAVVPHSAVSTVGRNLCAQVPENVSFEQAAYTSVASIALQGVRLAKLNLGESVLVVGLGLIGQICVCLLKAQGCRVFGTDPDPAKLELARGFGADAVANDTPLQRVKDFSGSFGVDAVLLTAATESNGPIELAAEVCRPRGRIVLVGVVGLEIPRPPFFAKELEFTVSYSLGPGRGDPIYEQKGIDYPIGPARWTAQRNMQAVLGLMSAGKLPVERLTTHRFPVERANEAYDLITKRQEPFLGIVIEYSDLEQPRHRVELNSKRAPQGELGVSLIGVGNFARLVMLPALAQGKGIAWRGICTAHGVNAEHTGRKMDFAFVTTDANEIFKDPESKAVLITTRHDIHAELVIAGLRAGKHVFVEKPLCINSEQLTAIARTVEELGPRCPMLMVGFNRRFAQATANVRKFFEGTVPLSILYRFSPGYLPANHWTQDEEVGGGRVVGEACHAIDLCVALTDSVPVKVYAESVAGSTGLEIQDDRVAITLRHANGSVSCVSYQSGGDRGFAPERIEVFGGGRTAALDNWDAVELWSNGRRQKVNGRKDKGHAAELTAFLSACRSGGEWPIPWDHLYGVTWASLMAVRSLREGIPMTTLTETDASTMGLG